MNKWISESVLYHMDLRTLAARDPRNAVEAAAEQELPTEPIAYLARNLDLMRQLGVTALQLGPVFPMARLSPMMPGDPRAVIDFTNVDREYGSLDQFKSLLRSAHLQDQRVLLEIDPAWISRDHPWVREHPEYIRGGESGSATGLARLDYGAETLRRAIREVLAFWLAVNGEDEDGVVQGVDGFRIDNPGAVSDPTFWGETLAYLEGLHPDRELLFVAADPDPQSPTDWSAQGFQGVEDLVLYDVFRACYAVDEHGITRILASTEPEDDPGKWSAFTDRGLAGAVERVLTEVQAPLEHTSARWVRFLDHPLLGRGVYRFGEGGTLAVNQLQFLLGRTVPQLMTGQEFGALNRPARARRIGTFARGRRLLAGDGVEDIRGVEMEGNLFARGRQQRLGWYAFFQDLIAVRQQAPELIHGSFRLLEAGEKCPQNQRTVVAFERKHRDGVVRCAVNLGPEPRQLAHAGLFEHPPLYGAFKDGVLAPFTSIVVRSA